MTVKDPDDIQGWSMETQPSGAPDTRHEVYLEKPLPSSEESERVVLGAVLLDHRVLTQLTSVLEVEDFYSPLNRRVYAGMIACHKLGHDIDPIMVGEELKKEGSLDSIGGVSAITNLTFGLPHFSNVDSYVKLIKDKATIRKIIRECQAITDRALAEEDDALTMVADASGKFIHLQSHVAFQSQGLAEVVDNVSLMFDAWTEGNQSVSAIRTGIPEVDGFLKYKGIAKGELTLIGARPSTGKTALLLQIATNAVRMKVPTLFISLEMMKEKLVMRMLPAMTGVPNKAINPYTFKQNPEVGAKLREALHSVRDLPMYFDRAPQIDKLIAGAEHFIQTKGVELVVFDYLTLIKSGAIARRGQNRDEEVGRFADEMKELALRRNVAVLGAAQLNRESDKETRAPRLTDFRESGVIEQVVDVALFPWDPGVKEHRKDPNAIKDSMMLKLYCDKQRDGARNWSVDLYFDKNQQTLLSAEMRTGASQVEYREPTPDGGVKIYKGVLPPASTYEPVEHDPEGPGY